MTRPVRPPLGPVRHLAAVGVALPLGLLLLAGCAAGDPGRAASPSESPGAGAANETAAADVQEALAQRDDVASAEVRYVDVFENPENGIVDAVMQPGADPQAIADEAVRLMWLSELDPLSVISVSVTNPADPPNGATRTVNLLQDAQRDPLEEQYGPRPE